MKIEVATEEIKQTDEERLRQWLVDGGAGIAMKIVEGRAKKHQADAMNEALKHNNDFGFDAAKALTDKAERYSHFLEVLEELIQQPEEERFLKTTLV